MTTVVAAARCQPRRSSGCRIGCTMMTSTAARSRGASTSRAACMPVSTTTAAARNSSVRVEGARPWGDAMGRARSFEKVRCTQDSARPSDDVCLWPPGRAYRVDDSLTPSSEGDRPMSPTVVLVHGAFADASGWGGVITRLSAAGYRSYAPANPLRSISGDAAYIRSFLSTIEGDVVLVGHSYGGAVITNAAVGADNVKALVYVAAFALDEGESTGAALALTGDPVDLSTVVTVRPFP